MGQSAVQLLSAKETANYNLQKQLIQSGTAQQHQVDTLHELTTSNYQRNVDNMFSSIPIFDCSKKEDIFE